MNREIFQVRSYEERWVFIMLETTGLNQTDLNFDCCFSLYSKLAFHLIAEIEKVTVTQFSFDCRPHL